jgi:hypothetical protein
MNYYRIIQCGNREIHTMVLEDEVLYYGCPHRDCPPDAPCRTVRTLRRRRSSVGGE